MPVGVAATLGDVVFVVVAGERATRALGPAMLWAKRRGASRLHLVADDPVVAGVLARRASLGGAPVDVWSWSSDGASIANPAPTSPLREADPAHLAFAPHIEAAGADVVVEHGVVVGEVLGLEVCRVIDDSGVARLAVGVGAHDRETQRLVHGDTPDALARVVGQVSQVRSSDDAHPLARLAPERLIRHRVSSRPEILGVRSLSPAEPPEPRRSLLDDSPCVAVDDTGSVVVVCVGHADVDVVPWGLDARLRIAPDAELRVVGLTGNLPTAVREMAAILDRDVSFVELSRSGS